MAGDSWKLGYKYTIQIPLHSIQSPLVAPAHPTGAFFSEWALLDLIYLQNTGKFIPQPLCVPWPIPLSIQDSSLECKHLFSYETFPRTLDTAHTQQSVLLPLRPPELPCITEQNLTHSHTAS